MGAVAFVLLLVLAPVAPTASLGAAAATGGPDGAAPSTAPVSDSVDEEPERRVRFDGEVRREKLSGGLRFQLQDASANERVPVLVVFERQPDEAFDLNRATKSTPAVGVREAVGGGAVGAGVPVSVSGPAPAVGVSPSPSPSVPLEHPDSVTSVASPTPPARSTSRLFTRGRSPEGHVNLTPGVGSESVR